MLDLSKLNISFLSVYSFKRLKCATFILGENQTLERLHKIACQNVGSKIYE